MTAVRTERDRQLSPSSVARDAQGTLTRYRLRSREARRDLVHHADLRYGPHPAEVLHHFPPRRPGSPLLVFVHGGHWQESSKEDACFPAPGLIAAGFGYVALGYGLAPERSLPEMTGSVRRGLTWVRDHAARLGGREDTVFVAGSSAGAHLAAMAADLPLAGLFLLSGLYDLTPVIGSYVNEALGLTPGEVARLSPLLRPPPAVPVVLAVGEHETGEYHGQQRRYAAALRRGATPVTELVVAGRDHFDLPFDLGDPATELGAAVARAAPPEEER